MSIAEYLSDYAHDYCKTTVIPEALIKWHMGEQIDERGEFVGVGVQVPEFIRLLQSAIEQTYQSDANAQRISVEDALKALHDSGAIDPIHFLTTHSKEILGRETLDGYIRQDELECRALFDEVFRETTGIDYSTGDGFFPVYRKCAQFAHAQMARLNQEGFSVRGGFRGYLSFVKTSSEHELENFVNFGANATIHFFRDDFSMELINQCESLAFSIHDVLVLACSTGAEVYSLIMDLLNREIPFGTVIGVDFPAMVGYAERGIFPPRGIAIDRQDFARYEPFWTSSQTLSSIEQIRPGYRARFFRGDDLNVVCDDVRAHARFIPYNLKHLLQNPTYFEARASGSNPNVIVCRNLFKYLVPENVTGYVHAFHSLLPPRGLLVIGSPTDGQPDPAPEREYFVPMGNSGFIYQRR